MNTLINICGAGRSGTTMLDLIMGNADNAFSCGEVNAWFYPWRKYHKRIDCACGQDPCPIWEKIKTLPERTFHFDAARILEVDFIVDSSKELNWVIDNNVRYKDGSLCVFNILVYKDPVDLAYSHYKRGEDLWAWKSQFNSYHKRLFETNIPFMSVSYSDLTNKPQDTIQNICTYTGMEYTEGKVQFWNKQHHHLFGSGGTRKQIGQNTCIQKPSFSERFIKDMALRRDELEDDDQIHDIIEQLKSRDVKLLGSHYHKQPYGERHGDIYLPTWYYVRKMKRVFWRLFPQPNIFSGVSKLTKDRAFLK